VNLAHSLPSSVEAKNERSYMFTPLYAYGEYEGNFTFHSTTSTSTHTCHVKIILTATVS
jgi:hypothetical protein